MKHRTLLPPTVHPSMRTVVRSREWRYSLVNLYPTRSGRMWTSDGAKRQAAAEAAVGSRSQSRLSQRVKALSLFLFAAVFATLISLYFSYGSFRSRRRHISTYLHNAPLQCARMCSRLLGYSREGGEKERYRSRAARLYASATLNHSLEITYVWIDSYYYKAYVGRACAVGGPTIDSPDWPSDLNFFLASFDFCYLYRRRLSPLLNGRDASLLADRY